MAKREKRRHPILSNKDINQLEKAMQQIMPRMVWYNKQKEEFNRAEERYNNIEDFILDRTTDRKNLLTARISRNLLESFVTLSNIFTEMLTDFESSIDTIADVDKKGMALFEIIHDKKKQKEAAANIARFWELFAPVCETITRLQERWAHVTKQLEQTELLLRQEIN